MKLRISFLRFIFDPEQHDFRNPMSLCTSRKNRCLNRASLSRIELCHLAVNVTMIDFYIETDSTNPNGVSETNDGNLNFMNLSIYSISRFSIYEAFYAVQDNHISAWGACTSEFAPPSRVLLFSSPARRLRPRDQRLESCTFHRSGATPSPIGSRWGRFAPLALPLRWSLFGWP